MLTGVESALAKVAPTAIAKALGWAGGSIVQRARDKDVAARIESHLSENPDGLPMPDMPRDVAAALVTLVSPQQSSNT